MNNYRNTLNNYQHNQILTASPEQIMIMLYEGAIRFVKQARTAMENGDRVTKLEKVSRAMAILTELSNTLDFENGGRIAEELDGLYAFMIKALTNSNIKNDPEPLETVVNILSELHDAWVQAADQFKNEKNKKDEEYGGQADASETKSIRMAY